MSQVLGSEFRRLRLPPIPSESLKRRVNGILRIDDSVEGCNALRAVREELLFLDFLPAQSVSIALGDLLGG